MAAEVQKINPRFPHRRLLQHAARILAGGGIVVYPTDTIYGLGASIFSRKAIEKVIKLKKASKHKLLSFISPDLKDVARWAFVPDYAYRIMRRITPGKYTFILRASQEVPKLLWQKRQTVGLRIPDSAVALGLARELGHPILSTSVPQGEGGFYADPDEIEREFRHDIDLILSAGVLANQPSTIVDFTEDSPRIIRPGAGDVRLLFG